MARTMSPVRCFGIAGQHQLETGLSVPQRGSCEMRQLVDGSVVTLCHPTTQLEEALTRKPAAGEVQIKVILDPRK